MKWKIEYFELQDFVKITTEGVFSVGDHLEMTRDIVSQKFWKPGKNVLFDHQKLEFIETDVDMMRKVSENHQKFERQIGDGKAAIVMKSLENYARGRQFELLTDKKVSAKLNIFMNKDAALKWLLS